MLDEPFKYGLLAALAIALLVAAFTDLRHRRIGNWLNGAIALAAPLFWWASGLALWPDLALQLGVALSLRGGVLTVVFGAWHVMRRQRERLAVPYGVAIATAGLWVLGTDYLPQTAVAGGLG